MENFIALGLVENTLKAIADLGFSEPTAIQQQAIPILLERRDLLGCAQTGTGKTAAFSIPILQLLDEERNKNTKAPRRIKTLILTPTRELAIQVAEALHKYGKHKEVETLPIYGGQPYERQFRGLQRGVQIVVGTPGRVMDHMRRGTLNLDNVRFFVLRLVEAGPGRHGHDVPGAARGDRHAPGVTGGYVDALPAQGWCYARQCQG